MLKLLKSLKENGWIARKEPRIIPGRASFAAK
jgi:hypothetical protein